MSDSSSEEPSVSWWLNPSEFDTRLKAFNTARKVMGDHDLPPAVRTLLNDIEVCQHLAASDLPRRKT